MIQTCVSTAVLAMCIMKYHSLITNSAYVFDSAGIGRTGTYIGLHYLLDQADAEGQVDVLQAAHIMRSNRVNMIQTCVSTAVLAVLMEDRGRESVFSVDVHGGWGGGVHQGVGVGRCTYVGVWVHCGNSSLGPGWWGMEG